jgi:hypothetical protein
MTTQAATASVTSPGAGATLASITIPTALAGTEFEVVASVWYAGTLVLAADSDNVAIQSDPVTAGTFVTAEVLSAPAVVATGEPTLFRCNLVAQATIKLIAVAAGTASSIYHVHLEANPVVTTGIGETT